MKKLINNNKGSFFSKRFMKIYTFPIFHQFFHLNFWRSLWLAEGRNLNSNLANHMLCQKFRGKNWWNIGKVYIFINLFKKKLPLMLFFYPRHTLESVVLTYSWLGLTLMAVYLECEKYADLLVHFNLLYTTSFTMYCVSYAHATIIKQVLNS